jgi:hypothetical protein
MIATLDGADGKLLDQRTSTSPTFGSRNFPLGSTANWAFVVNRADCRRSLRDFGRGRPIFGPLRAPDRDSKKFRYAAFRSARDCCSGTADTSFSRRCPQAARRLSHGQ